jgi:hypothetical protein
MKTTRLFHTIVMVGVTLTAPAGLTAAALTMSGCDQPESGAFPTIDLDRVHDMAHFVVIDMPFPTIEIDLGRIVDLGSRD